MSWSTEEKLIQVSKDRSANLEEANNRIFSCYMCLVPMSYIVNHMLEFRYVFEFMMLDYVGNSKNLDYDGSWIILAIQRI